MSALISVVTLTHNKLDYTRICLASLLRTTWRPWELVVVDNGSTDGTGAWLASFREEAGALGVDVRVVRNAGNVGCSTARNQGIEEARGEWVVFVDNDVALRSADWLRGLTDCVGSAPDVGIAGPKLVYPFPPHDIQFAGGAVSPSGRVQFMGRGRPRDDPRFNRRRETQCSISACFMLPAAVLAETGGFDEAFNPVEYEDIDLSYRVRSRGYRILYEPAVEMYHFENATTRGTPSLPNTALIVRHGLLFKRRWRHMFSREDGPADEDTKWRQIETRGLAEVGDMPVIYT